MLGNIIEREKYDKQEMFNMLSGKVIFPYKF